MKLNELLYGIDVHCVSGISRSADIGGITHDSERAARGRLFVCVKGTKHDGHDFVRDAYKRGAAAAVVERGRIPDCAIPYIEVADTRKALAVLHYNRCKRPCDDGRMKLVAVTGTNGKTTTASLIAAILTEAGRKTAVIGTLGGSLTTPDPDELYPKLSEYRRHGVEYVIMEASSHALALSKLEPLTFDAAVFTNLTPEHLDFHGDMENYFAAKCRLFEKCRTAVINGDDMYGRRINVGENSRRVYYSSADETAAYRAEAVNDRGIGGMGYTLVWQNGRVNINTPMVGGFALYNTLAAAACALELGVSPRAVQEAPAAFGGADGRMERLRFDELPFDIYIDYAHTPDALEKTLGILRGLKRGRLIVMFGCGGDRDRQKRPEMGAIASRLADLVIVTSDNSRSEDPDEIIKQIVKGIDRERKYTVIPDRREAIRYAVNAAGEGDIVLLAGKGHERYEIDKNGRHGFDEREFVRDAVLKRAENM